MRTLGFYRNAKKHIGLLSDKPRTFLQKYVEGVNEFIKTRPKNIHLEFSLAGIKPAPWTMVDPLTILYYMGWGSAANVGAEIIAQMLVEKLGPARAAEIFPITINPDDESATNSDNTNPPFQTAQLDFQFNKTLLSFLADGPLKMGSNNWAASRRLSPGTNPLWQTILTWTPQHLPGPWYPCGLITPDIRAVGVTIPGIGGMVIGRTKHIAFGITNAYGDTQDLYVETVDPNEPKTTSKEKNPYRFMVIEETLKIKDKTTPGGFRRRKSKFG